MNRDFEPFIFRAFPAAKQFAIDTLTARLKILSTDTALCYFRTEFIDMCIQMEHQKTNDNENQNNDSNDSTDITNEERELSMKRFHLVPLYAKTAHTQLTTFLGFKYGPRQNNYYSNKHEEQQEVRKTFIKEYIQHEKHKCKGVQISEDNAKQLEINHEELKTIPFHAYDSTVDGTKMREYHIYSHQKLFIAYVSDENCEVHGGGDIQPHIRNE